jgi:hypothetical protein
VETDGEVIEGIASVDESAIVGIIGESHVNVLQKGGRYQIGMVAAIKSVAWPRSNRNRWSRCLGIRTRLKT